MIRLYRLQDLAPGQILNRDPAAQPEVEAAVDAIIAQVRARGDDALRDYALRFDGAKLDALEVTPAEMEQALEQVDPAFLNILRDNRKLLLIKNNVLSDQKTKDGE